jgi:hypothetical protein
MTDFEKIIFNGFSFELPSETVQIISNLSLQVGSPSYVKTPVFNKKETSPVLHSFADSKRKKRGIELNNDDWETLRNYQPTKIEKKEGVYAEIDNARSFLNKMTDKNYDEMKNKILELLCNIKTNYPENESEVIFQMGENIFNIASNNRFYSKIYADLYSELIHVYQQMRDICEVSFSKFMDLFHTIEFVNSAEDYEKFCLINKDNEKRKALSCFFVNLMINGIVTKKQIMGLVIQLLNTFDSYISQENKVNEVNEISENISFLLKKDCFTEEDYDVLENGMGILKYIELIANSKSKNFKSLSTKSIFKFMDMVDM